MDRPPVGFNQVGLWSSKNYRIAANVHILQNVMLIFRMVPTNTGKKLIPANWILKRTKIILKKIILKKTNSLFKFFTITRKNHWHDANIFIGFCAEAVW